MERKTPMRKPSAYTFTHTSRCARCAVLTCVCIIFASMPDCAGADTWYPPGYPNEPGIKTSAGPNHAASTDTARTGVAHTHRRAESSSKLNPLVQGVRFFQKFISPVDSPRCPMYPTCSTYALQALHRHGPVLGSFITVDRLLHETSPEEQSIPLEGFERTRYYDPLNANDFWLE